MAISAGGGTSVQRNLLARLIGHRPDRHDTATRLLHHFGSIGALFSARADAIADIADQPTAERIAAARDMLAYSLRDRTLDERLELGSADFVTYLRATLADRPSELVQVFYLDGGNRLIAEECASQGEAGRASVSPRAILKRALELESRAIVLAHNHPGGHRGVSGKDIEFTQKLTQAGRALDVTVHDHFVVVGDRCLSMKAGGFLC